MLDSIAGQRKRIFVFDRRDGVTQLKVSPHVLYQRSVAGRCTN